MAESFSRENQGTRRRKKVDEKSCVTFLLSDPGWYVRDVQNGWEENTHTLQYMFNVYSTAGTVAKK